MIPDQHVAPVTRWLDTISIAKHLQNASHLHQSEAAVAHSRFLYPRGVRTGDPGSANVIVTYLAPLQDLVREDQTIEMVDQNILIIAKRFVETRPHKKTVMSCGSSKKLFRKPYDLKALPLHRVSARCHQVFVWDGPRNRKRWRRDISSSGSHSLRAEAGTTTATVFDGVLFAL